MRKVPGGMYTIFPLRETRSCSPLVNDRHDAAKTSVTNVNAASAALGFPFVDMLPRRQDLLRFSEARWMKAYALKPLPDNIETLPAVA